MEFDRRKKLVFFFGCVTSVLLILALGALRENYPAEMELEAHWVAIGMLPLLFFLLFGGVISKAKALGIEFELALSSPIGDFWARIEEFGASRLLNVSQNRTLRKLSVDYLKGLEKAEAEAIQILRFNVDQDGGYDPSALLAYFQFLPNLSFLEVVKDEKQVWIIPMSHFFVEDGERQRHHENQSIMGRIEQFVNILNRKTCHKLFLDVCFPNYKYKVTKDTSIKLLIDKVCKERKPVITIFDENDLYLGAVLPDHLLQLTRWIIKDS